MRGGQLLLNCPLEMASCGESSLSLSTAPAQCVAPHCFPPRASFRERGGARVTAAGLTKGRVILGPCGKEVLVLRSIRHQPVEVDMIHIKMETHSYPFQVSRQHRIPAIRPDNKLAVVQAGDLALGWHLFDAAGVIRQVVDVKAVRETTEVVELTFAEDAIVLMWVLPKNAKTASRPPLRDSAGVWCFGAGLADELFSSLRILHTFLSMPCNESDGDAKASRSVARSSDGRLESTGFEQK